MIPQLGMYFPLTFESYFPLQNNMLKSIFKKIDHLCFSAGSGPVSTMGGMMGGGVKGGPTSGGMMSTPRAMGPGSTSTMGKID